MNTPRCKLLTTGDIWHTSHIIEGRTSTGQCRYDQGKVAGLQVEKMSKITSVTEISECIYFFFFYSLFSWSTALPFSCDQPCLCHTKMRQLQSKLPRTTPSNHSEPETPENTDPLQTGNTLSTRFLQQNSWRLFSEARHNPVPLWSAVNPY